MNVKTLQYHGRRLFLGRATAAAAGVSMAGLPSLPPAQAAETALARLPLSVLDPDGPVGNYWAHLRAYYYEYGAANELANFSWSTYQQTRRPEHGEWSLKAAYIWWRAAPTRDLRIRASRIGHKMALSYRQDFPDEPAGHLFRALFIGSEALSVGVLDSLHRVKELRSALDATIERHPDYMYGLGLCVYAKMFTKLPGFPMSVGDLDKALAYLEQARPYGEKIFAPWYLFLAEAAHLSNGPAAALDVLDRMRREIKPTSMETIYLYDAMLSDANALRTAIGSGDYNKYTFDPVLEPARPFLPMRG